MERKKVELDEVTIKNKTFIIENRFKEKIDKDYGIMMLEQKTISNPLVNGCEDDPWGNAMNEWMATMDNPFLQAAWHRKYDGKMPTLNFTMHWSDEEAEELTGLKPVSNNNNEIEKKN